jgi:hypothetical protein
MTPARRLVRVLLDLLVAHLALLVVAHMSGDVFHTMGAQKTNVASVESEITTPGCLDLLIEVKNQKSADNSATRFCDS